MEYKLGISTETKKNVFYFEKTRYARTFDEIVDYAIELAKIFKESAKLTVIIYDENEKKIAMYDELG